MKFHQIAIFLAFFTAVLAAFSAEDEEIFKVNFELQKKFGKDFNFYKFLDIPQKADFKQISKQIKKLSVKWHPDKAKGKKNKKLANEKFQYLSVVGNILKSGQLKERYDFYLKNGFPVYKNNRFLFEKFKPSLLFVVLFLYLIVEFSRFFIIKIQVNSNKKKLQNLIDEITKLATEQNPDPLAEKRLKIEGLNKWFLVRIDGVFETDPEGEILYKLSTNEFVEPDFNDLLIMKLINKILGIQVVKEIPQESFVKDLKSDAKKKSARSKPKGEKKVLPNGKVIYSKKKT